MLHKILALLLHKKRIVTSRRVKNDALRHVMEIFSTPHQARTGGALSRVPQAKTTHESKHDRCSSNEEANSKQRIVSNHLAMRSYRPQHNNFILQHVWQVKQPTCFSQGKATTNAHPAIYENTYFDIHHPWQVKYP